jgi:hypothetical protein
MFSLLHSLARLRLVDEVDAESFRRVSDVVEEGIAQKTPLRIHVFTQNLFTVQATRHLIYMQFTLHLTGLRRVSLEKGSTRFGRLLFVFTDLCKEVASFRAVDLHFKRPKTPPIKVSP